MIGVLTAITATARTPSGQPDNRLSIYGELPEAMQMVSNAAILMTEVVELLTFNNTRAIELVDSGWIMATDLSDSLVQQCGLDFRSSHQLVAFLASAYADKSMTELTPDNLNHAAEIVLGQSLVISAVQLKNALDSRQALQARTEIGGTAIESMNHMIADCQLQLAGINEATQKNKTYFATIELKLSEFK